MDQRQRQQQDMLRQQVCVCVCVCVQYLWNDPNKIHFMQYIPLLAHLLYYHHTLSLVRLLVFLCRQFLEYTNVI